MTVKITLDRRSVTDLNRLVTALLTNGCPSMARTDAVTYEQAVSWRQHLLILTTWFSKSLRRNTDNTIKLKAGPGEALDLLWLMANWDFFENAYIGATLTAAEQELTNLILNTIQTYNNDAGTHLHHPRIG